MDCPLQGERSCEAWQACFAEHGRGGHVRLNKHVRVQNGTVFVDDRNAVELDA